MRRVKNVAYDDDDWDDGWAGSSWSGGGGGGGGGWNEGYSGGGASKPKSTAKAAAKTATKAAAKPAAAKAKSAAAAPAAAAPAAATSVKASAAVEELQLALAPAGKLEASRVEKCLSSCDGKAEDAFLKLLEEELAAGNWKPQAEDAEPAKAEASKDFAPPERAAAKGKAKAKAQAASEKEPAAAKEAKKEEPEEAPAAVPAAVVDDDGRPCISLVVVGHVDAGKSTLMGHLLCLVGEVNSKTLHKFEKESKELGKASFAYAWVLDEGEDERARGVTIDVCVKHFATKERRFTILDAPGHRDFVPNMLQGAVQADVALLVADVTHFDSGFERGGQTKEHLQLVRSLGITNVIVAINKLDAVKWSEQVYEEIKGRLHNFIVGKDCGFKASNVSYIPLSGFSGENMLERKSEELSKWWKGPTLIEALNQLEPPPRPPASGPLRIPIADLYRSGSNAIASGRIEAGSIAAGQKVLLMPSNEVTTAKALNSRNIAVKGGAAGSYIDGITMPVELQFATIGGVICDTKNPVPCVDTFQAQLLIFDVEVPIMKGQQFMCYLHVETLRATVTRLEKLIEKGKPLDKRPKCLQKGNVAIVTLSVDRKVCLEPKPAGGAPTSLSRLVLRDKGRTVAAGVVSAIK
eukprot:TRINITY_DN6745_c0_g1_i1.p1 TRINITY_DN6745_c0_g1~~TRINITY_DN6745_c0_g1_i1.p1  ORF type:complete len:670 (-),score=206.97 TRINITY_DN6745_c0_g1_i1:89-1993(-)